MITRNRENLVSPSVQALEKFAGLPELLSSSALCEVAAYDDEIGFELLDFEIYSLHQRFIVRAEVKIGKVH